MSRENWDSLQSAFELHGSTVEAVVDLTGAFGFYTYRAADSSRTIERISNNVIEPEGVSDIWLT